MHGPYLATSLDDVRSSDGYRNSYLREIITFASSSQTVVAGPVMLCFTPTRPALEQPNEALGSINWTFWDLEHPTTEILIEAEQVYGGWIGGRTAQMAEYWQDQQHFHSNKQVEITLPSLSSYYMRGLGVRDNKHSILPNFLLPHSANNHVEL